MPVLLNVAEKFCTESKWGWHFSAQNSEQSFNNMINHPECDVIIVETDDAVLLGVAVVSTETDFQVETVGDINEFYVMPEARGTGVGRFLLKAMCDWFDARGCVNVFVKSTANIGQAAAFANLFAKYDFKVFSSVLVR